MGELKAKTRGRIFWIWWKSLLLKKDSVSRCYSIRWEESNITTVDNVIWGCPQYLNLSNICSIAHTVPHFCGIIRKKKNTLLQTTLWTAHFATKNFNWQFCTDLLITIQSQVHDFPPDIKSLNRNVSSSLSIITKSIHLNRTELNGIWVRALPGPMHIRLRTGPLCPMFYY